ncbi:MAG: hypothetical protein A2882_14700, partial [Phenylobacterium sp. RIFCSPHIGHO2_01_FULL_70_10]
MDVVFTIVSRNYAAQAAVLMRSLAQVEPDCARVVIGADGPIPELEPYARVVEARDTGAPVAPMSVYYDALELNTAVKPHAFRRLLAEPGVTSVTYLDPDIFVYAPLDDVRRGLAEAPLVLIPHLTRPLAGEASPSDHTILTSGGFNLGFMSARREDQIFALLDWWAEKCRFDCRVDFQNGLFTDQKWMDLAPGLVSDLAILRDPGLDIAYWNLEGRTLSNGPDGWRVNGRPLVFFHFSGFDPARPEVLSKHQDRIVVPAGSPLAHLLADYAKALLDNGHAQASRTPYAYAAFPSGRPVTAAMRRRALRAAREGQRFDAGLSNQVEAWMDGPDPLGAAEDLPDVTREMDQVWREDAFAAARFARDNLDDRLAFHAWFGERPQTQDASRRAADALLEAWRAGTRQPNPWPQQDRPWSGAAAGVEDWLTAPGERPLPRAAAALLSVRADLRARFEAAEPETLFAWLVGPEAQARRFAPALVDGAARLRLSDGGASLIQAARFARAAEPGLSPLKLQISAGYGLGVRAGWTGDMLREIRRDGDHPVGSLSSPFPFPRVLLWIWESRPDLQRLFPLHTALGRLRYLRWLLGGGFAEYDMEVEGLPEPLTRSVAFAFTRLSVRNAAPTLRSRRTAKIAAVVVVESETADMAAWPQGVLVFEAACGKLRRADGAPVGPIAADMVIFATRPVFAPADAIALIAHGVSWERAAGAWASDGLCGLAETHPAWGFVDEVWTDRPCDHAAP